MVDGEETLCTTMSALAILSCRPNSHPFQERHISLHETVKIGRSVARARPSANNGIFDCKVLSRHHAMLWYEAGKFYLQDTKSSNGTFINNQRLCKGGEESPAREIYSGDLIQFGVEVMENNRRGEKITHGCIIATITLYHPDGREAKPISYLGGENQPGLSLQTQDLYQLAQYLQEALHREKMLEQKLLTLQQLVHNTQEASESGWQALIDEDKLLSRLEMLENQLHIYSKNHSEDTLRQELVALQEDKDKYETTSKESLRRVLQEKLEAVTKLSDLEQSLGNMKEECGHLKAVCEVSQDELSQLAQKYQDQLKEVADLQDKLQEAEHNHVIEIERIEEEKAAISTKLEEMTQQEVSLSAKIESLQADNDFTKEQLAAMKAKLESLKEFNEDEPKLSDIDLNGSTTEEVDIIPLGPPKEDDKPENLEAKLKDLQQLIETYKDKLEKSDQKLKESNNKVEKVQKELDTAVTSSNEYLHKITSLEAQLEESAKQSNSSNDLIEVFKDHIHLAEKELTFQTPVNSMQNSTEVLQGRENEGSQPDRLDSTIVMSPSSSHPLPNSSTTTATTTSSSSSILSQNNQANLGRDTTTSPSFTSPPAHPPPDLLNDTVGVSSTPFPSTDPNDDSGHGVTQQKSTSSLSDSGIVTLSSSSTSSHTSSNLNGMLMPGLDDDEGLKALLEEAKEAQQRAEQELSKCREEKDVSENKLRRTSDEVSSLKAQLMDAEREVKEKSDLILDLQDQVEKAERFTQDVKQEILDLREQLEGEKVKNKTTELQLEDTKMQLSTSQQNAKQNHNETEHLRDKLRHLQDELESERNRRESPRLGHSDRLTPKSKEYQALKEECANLRKRIQAIEAEMKMSRKENLHLSSEYNKLQESYKHLESLKVKLETSEVSWKINLTDAQKDAHIVRQETSNSSDGAGAQSSSSFQGKLDEANSELVSLRQSCEEKTVEISCLQKQVNDLATDYNSLQKMSRMVSLVSSIPLLMLLFAILMVAYPMLEAVTARLS